MTFMSEPLRVSCISSLGQLMPTLYAVMDLTIEVFDGMSFIIVNYIFYFICHCRSVWTVYGVIHSILLFVCLTIIARMRLLQVWNFLGLDSPFHSLPLAGRPWRDLFEPSLGLQFQLRYHRGKKEDKCTLQHLVLSRWCYSLLVHQASHRMVRDRNPRVWLPNSNTGRKKKFVSERFFYDDGTKETDLHHLRYISASSGYDRIHPTKALNMT